MILIVYAGTSASGKDSAADYTVQKYGAVKRTLSDIIRTYLPPGASNAALRVKGNELRSAYGQHILARLAHEELRAMGTSLGVIASVRHPAEAKYLQEQGGVFAWFDAPEQTRYERYASRGEQGRPPMTFSEFVTEEALQFRGDGTGYSLEAVRNLVPQDNHIWNTYPSVDMFLNRVDAFLRHAAKIPA